MKMSHSSQPSPRAFTLLELTMVILVLLTLISIGLFTNNKVDEWKLGRAASEELRSVYSAQRMYLADNPRAIVADLGDDDIRPYLPNNVAVMPTVKSLEGTILPILVNQSPPVIDGGGGAAYDPSGSPTDSLWDVGE